MRKLFYLMLLAVVVGCGNDSETGSLVDPPDTTIDISKLQPSCFVPFVANPILASGDLFENSTWNDPHVLKVDDEYIMYASSDIGFNQDIKIYRLISADGISWERNPVEAVFSAGADGTWDDKSTETPSIVFFDGNYHLFYTGYGDTGLNPIPQDFRIGHATSPDGITWIRETSSPVVVPSNVFLDFDESVVAEPGAVVFDNQIYLYFTAIGANIGLGTTLQVLGLTIYDGSNWSEPISVLEPDQSIYPRGDVDDGWIGYSTPSAIVIEGVVHLFFDVAKVDTEGWLQRKLHHANSSDGINGWMHDAVSIHSREDFSWSAKDLRSINPFMDGNQLRIYYAGHKDLDLGIGFSSCDLSK